MEFDAVTAAEENHHLHHITAIAISQLALCGMWLAKPIKIQADRTFSLAFFFKNVKSSRKRLSAGTTQ